MCFFVIGFNGDEEIVRDGTRFVGPRVFKVLEGCSEHARQGSLRTRRRPVGMGKRGVCRQDTLGHGPKTRRGNLPFHAIFPCSLWSEATFEFQFIHRLSFASMTCRGVANRSRDLAMSLFFLPTRFSTGGRLFPRNGVVFAPDSRSFTTSS
jgi:hypothetical protein